MSLSQAKRLAIVSWFNSLTENEFSQQSILTDFADAQQLIKLATSISLTSTDNVNSPEETFDFLKLFIDDYFHIQSQSVIDFSKCIKKNEFEIAKILVFLLSARVQQLVPVNSPALITLTQLDCDIQKDIEQCLSFVLNIHSFPQEDLNHILGQQETRISPRRPSFKTPKQAPKRSTGKTPSSAKKSGRMSFGSATYVSSPSTPIKDVLGSPLMLEQVNNRKKDWDLRNLREQLRKEENKNIDLSNEIIELQKKIENEVCRKESENRNLREQLHVEENKNIDFSNEINELNKNLEKQGELVKYFKNKYNEGLMSEDNINEFETDKELCEKLVQEKANMCKKLEDYENLKETHDLLKVEIEELNSTIKNQDEKLAHQKASQEAMQLEWESSQRTREEEVRLYDNQKNKYESIVEELQSQVSYYKQLCISENSQSIRNSPPSPDLPKGETLHSAIVEVEYKKLQQILKEKDAEIGLLQMRKDSMEQAMQTSKIEPDCIEKAMQTYVIEPDYMEQEMQTSKIESDCVELEIQTSKTEPDCMDQETQTLEITASTSQELDQTIEMSEPSTSSHHSLRRRYKEKETQTSEITTNHTEPLDQKSNVEPNGSSSAKQSSFSIHYKESQSSAESESKVKSSARLSFKGTTPYSSDQSVSSAFHSNKKSRDSTIKKRLKFACQDVKKVDKESISFKHTQKGRHLKTRKFDHQDTLSSFFSAIEMQFQQVNHAEVEASSYHIYGCVNSIVSAAKMFIDFFENLRGLYENMGDFTNTVTKGEIIGCMRSGINNMENEGFSFLNLLKELLKELKNVQKSPKLKNLKKSPKPKDQPALMKDPEVIQSENPQVVEVEIPQVVEVEVPQVDEIKNPQVIGVEVPQLVEVEVPQVVEIKNTHVVEVEVPQTVEMEISQVGVQQDVDMDVSPVEALQAIELENPQSVEIGPPRFLVGEVAHTIEMEGPQVLESENPQVVNVEVLHVVELENPQVVEVEIPQVVEEELVQVVEEEVVQIVEEEVVQIVEEEVVQVVQFINSQVVELENPQLVQDEIPLFVQVEIPPVEGLENPEVIELESPLVVELENPQYVQGKISSVEVEYSQDAKVEISPSEVWEKAEIIELKNQVRELIERDLLNQEKFVAIANDAEEAKAKCIEMQYHYDEKNKNKQASINIQIAQQSATDDLRLENQVLQNEITSLKSLCQKQKSKMEEMVNEMKEMHETVENKYRDHIKLLKQDREKYKSRFEKTTEEKNRCSDHIRVLKQDKEKYKSNCETAMKLADMQTKELTDKENYLKKYSAQLTSYQNKMESKKKEERQLKETLEREQNNTKSLNAKIDDLKVSVSTLYTEIGNLEKTLHAKDVKINHLESQVNKAEAQFNLDQKSAKKEAFDVNVNQLLKDGLGSKLYNKQFGQEKDARRRSQLIGSHIQVSNTTTITSVLMDDTSNASNLSFDSVKSSGFNNKSFLGNSSIYLKADYEEDFVNHNSIAELRGEMPPPESASKRLNELHRRNTLCLPHMRSTYPVETQVLSPTKYSSSPLVKSITGCSGLKVSASQAKRMRTNSPNKIVKKAKGSNFAYHSRSSKSSPRQPLLPKATTSQSKTPSHIWKRFGEKLSTPTSITKLLMHRSRVEAKMKEKKNKAPKQIDQLFF